MVGSNMTEQIENAFILITFLVAISVAFIWLEDHRDRIRELSHTLQLIELHTGIPYYSSLKKSHLGIEDSEWLTKAKSARQQESPNRA